MENQNVLLAKELIVSLLGDKDDISFLNITTDEGGIKKEFMMAMKTLVTHLSEINMIDVSDKEKFQKKFDEIIKTPPEGQEELVNIVNRGMCAVSAWKKFD